MSLINRIAKAIKSIQIEKREKEARELLRNIGSVKAAGKGLHIWRELWEKEAKGLLLTNSFLQDLAYTINKSEHKILAARILRDTITNGFDAFSLQETILFYTAIIESCKYEKVVVSAWQEIGHNLETSDLLNIARRCKHTKVTSSIWDAYKHKAGTDTCNLINIAITCEDETVAKEAWLFSKTYVLNLLKKEGILNTVKFPIGFTAKQLVDFASKSIYEDTAKEMLELIDRTIEGKYEKSKHKDIYLLLNEQARKLIRKSKHQSIREIAKQWLSKGLGKQRHELTSKTEKELAIEAIKSILNYGDKLIIDGISIYEYKRHQMFENTGLTAAVDTEEEENKELSKFFLKMPNLASFLLYEDWSTVKLKRIAKILKRDDDKHMDIRDLVYDC